MRTSVDRDTNFRRPGELMTTAARQRSTFVVSLTPFTESGDLDEPALRAHLHRQHESCVAGIDGNALCDRANEGVGGIDSQRERPLLER